MADAQAKKARALEAANRQYNRMRELHDWYVRARAALLPGEELELLPSMQEEVDKMLRWYANRRKASRSYRARTQAAM